MASRVHAPRRRFALPVFAGFGAAGLLVLGLGAGCSSSSDSSPQGGDVAFHAEQDLFSGFNADTGLVPAGQPVQIELTVSAKGSVTADAAAASDGKTVYGKPGSGKLALEGGFALQARLKVDLTGLPSYDGPVPGFENVNIAFAGDAAFDPFLLAGKAHVEASIPETKLPPIPLPGGIPGRLILTVSPESVVTSDFQGTCAAVEKGQAHYLGRTSTGGTLKLEPSIEIDIPIKGTKTFAIPEMTIAVPAATDDLDLGTEPVGPGDGTTPAGEAAKAGSCMGGDPAGSTSGATTGTGSGAGTGTGATSGGGGMSGGGGAMSGGTGVGGADAGAK